MSTQNAINSTFPVQPVAVTKGGTGVATLTAHAVLLGEGTSNVSSVGPGSAGQILLGAGSADPAFITPTAGSGLTVTTNATTLSYAINAPVSVSNGGTGLTSITAHGIMVGEGTSNVNPITLTNGQLLIGNSSSDPVAANISAGTGISITNGTGSITIASVGSGLSWVDQTTTTVTMAINTGYVADNAALVTLTLPTTAALGSVMRIVGKGAGGWTISQNSGQSIQFGSVSTTGGAGGSLSSTNTGDSIELVCITANTVFAVMSSVGNITYV